jgi:uncharacterized RDD family membrane protein YckC
MSATYEAVVLFGVVVFFGYGFSALTQFRGEAGPLRWAFQAFLFLVLGGYFVWFWSGGRCTLPMKTTGLRVVDVTGGPIGLPRAALRYLAGWLLLAGPLALAQATGRAWPMLLAPLGYAWALFDREGRTLYDLAAGTRLQLAPDAPGARPADQRRTQST